MLITGKRLSELTLEEVTKLYNEMSVPTAEEKEIAWKKMDTGIYDSDKNLIGDIFAEEDNYEE